MTTTIHGQRSLPTGSHELAGDGSATLGTAAPSVADLAEALRAAGHVVHARWATTGDDASAPLVRSAEEFLERVLAFSEVTASKHAYIRLYRSTQSLFLEVTQLAPESFRVITQDPAAHDTFDSIRRWAATSGHALSVRRGPRSQLRIAVMITP
jgi:hypothetical protein